MGKRALISVSDKERIIDFASRLTSFGYKIVSTGGTLKTLTDAGIPAISVSQLTQYPEVFGGRVKTLHPAIHGGILFRRGHQDDEATRRELNIDAIDMVVVNLYPFRKTVANPQTTEREAIEQIDIGGPCLVRAAAKNASDVAVVVDPDDYAALADELEEHDGLLSLQTRKKLAIKAFEHTARYDAAIADYLKGTVEDSPILPTTWTIGLDKALSLRYGENPHQQAALYGSDAVPALPAEASLQGKALSYNNLLDLDAAVAAVAEFDAPTAVVIKHTNPCGVGTHATRIADAVSLALEGDPKSAFGGIIALNRPCDEDVTKRLCKLFFEVLVAPEFTEAAKNRLARRKNLRVVELDPRGTSERLQARFRLTNVGVVAQTKDERFPADIRNSWEVVTEAKPTTEQLAALDFLWRVCKHVRSNAIVIGSAERTFGVGAGQMSRVDAVEIALKKSTGDTHSACLASDAFFPFRDNIDVAAQAGIQAIVEPGGSRRDAEVIEAANEHGVAMVFTGRRHFRH